MDIWLATRHRARQLDACVYSPYSTDPYFRRLPPAPCISPNASQRLLPYSKPQTAGLGLAWSVQLAGNPHATALDKFAFIEEERGSEPKYLRFIKHEEGEVNAEDRVQGRQRVAVLAPQGSGERFVRAYPALTSA